MLYKPYQLKHLNFPTYLFAHPAFTEIANCTSGRTTYDCQARYCQYEIRYLYLTEQDLNL